MNSNSSGLAWVAVVIAIVALGVAFFGNGEVAPNAGGTRWPNGISADNTMPLAGQVRGTDLVITDDAAFTQGTFCIDGYATSTATAVKITASTTATIEGTDGVMVYTYGVCP